MRPRVTVTYAQSLDGSIALPGRRTDLSSPEALQMTHALRARHEAILVGIGTVLVDDPRLTVRLAPGPNPQPIVLDSQLRLPPTAALLSHPDKPLWVAAAGPPPGRVVALEALGVDVILVPPAAGGGVQLGALLDRLGERGVRSLMVEGGARVIQSFLQQRLAQSLVVTLSPQLLGGLRALESLPAPVWLRNATYRHLGPDLIVEADLEN